MISVDLRITGGDDVRAALQALAGPQAREAYAKALNDAGFKVRAAMKAEFGRVFDRVTPYIQRSPYVRTATPELLSVSIEPRSPGGKGVDPQRVLAAQEAGGRRRDKRSEAALRRVGILPHGYQTAIPSAPYPGSDDGRGNLRGPFLVQLLAYFQAFGEQGYSANMKPGARRLRDRDGRFVTRQNARRYFVSYGRLRGTHLAPGIWSAEGAYGAVVRPVVMFVRLGTYRPRIDLDAIVQAASAQEYLDRRVRFRLRQAAGV